MTRMIHRTPLRLLLPLAVAAIVLSGCESFPGPLEAEIPDEEPTAPAFTLVVGDCIAGGSDVAEIGQAALQSVPTVPCDEPHVQEVFASFQLPSGGYPGEVLIVEEANTGCLELFTDFIGIPAHESTLQTLSLFPTQGAWVRGDREVLCLVADPEGTVTGSLAGEQR